MLRVILKPPFAQGAGHHIEIVYFIVIGMMTFSKIKTDNPHVSADRERLPAERDAVGPGFEEPMPADDIGAYGQLVRHTNLPIAMGPRLYSSPGLGINWNWQAINNLTAEDSYSTFSANKS